MAKLDRSYETIYIRLSGIYKIKWLDEIYRNVWPRISTKKMYSPYLSQLMGACRPLADMLKDVTDTVQPYRKNSQIKKDFLQPIYGLGNVLKGVVYLVAIIPLFLFTLFYSVTQANSLSDYAKLAFLCNGNSTIAWLIDGVLSITRGVTQIAATPLTWLIKMPLRGAITALTDEKDLLIENKPSLRTLVAEMGNLNANVYTGPKKLYDLKKEIHEKYQKDLKNGGQSDISSAVENSYYSKDGWSNYLALFQPKKPPSQTNGEEPTPKSENSLNK